MVTYYNKKDLVLFANYVLAERQNEFKTVSYDEVSHTDFENWLEEMKKDKNGSD